MTFFSCQKSEESLLDGSATLNLSVQQENVVSIGRIKTVSTDNFAISIVDKSNDQEVLSYDRYADMPATVTLRQGEYKVIATSGTAISADFDNPVYYGESDLSITAGETSDVSIECLLSNVKVKITHTENAKTRFPDVFTRVTTGGDTLDYSQTESRFGYFALNGTPSTMTVAIHYTQNDVERVTSKTYEANANDFFNITINASLDGEGTIGISIGEENVIDDEIIIGSKDNGEELTFEREILMTLYNATNGANWTNNENWGSDKPVGEWYGVSTNLSGNIDSLNLFLNRLSGEIPSEIGDLSELVYLGLGANQLTGQIPSEIGNLSKLNILSLGSNQLSGTIPTTLGNLTELQWFSMPLNQLSGEIPLEIFELRKLTFLALRDNELSGSIPNELGNLTELVSLELSRNQLTGTIPLEIGNLTKLKYVYLNQNQLSGSIPSEIGNLTELYTLSLIENQFTGPIPSVIIDVVANNSGSVTYDPENAPL